MLLTMRFSKLQNGTFVAHTDILRALNRTFRRANIDINYSAGFNKHMLLKVTQPLPLGIASEGEYVTCDVKKEIDKEEFLSLFNKNCPPFLVATKCYMTETKPQLASLITASRYFFRTKEAYRYKEKIESFKGNFSFSYTHKEVTKIIDAGSLIFDIKVTEEGIEGLFASGGTNLRADAFSKALNTELGLHLTLGDIVRKEQYILSDGKYISADEYMRTIR